MTPLAFKQADPLFIRERLGVVVERLVLELRGVSCLDLERHTPDRKSIMASRSFGRPITTLTEMQEAVASYTMRAAEKLRRQALATAHLAVFIETNRFKPGERQHFASKPVQLPVATSDSAKLIRAARAGITALWRPGYRYKKAGVLLLDLHPANGCRKVCSTGTTMRVASPSCARSTNSTSATAATRSPSPPPAIASPGKCSGIGSRPAIRRHGGICCGCEKIAAIMDAVVAEDRIAWEVVIAKSGAI